MPGVPSQMAWPRRTTSATMRLRIPLKPTTDSNLKLATRNALKPASPGAHQRALTGQKRTVGFLRGMPQSGRSIWLGCVTLEFSGGAAVRPQRNVGQR